jgi:hypothetical protein
MSYIKKMNGELICSHPNVKKIHQWGGVSLGDIREPVDFLTLTMLDGNQKTFQERGNGEAVKEAEQYLQTKFKIS